MANIIEIEGDIFESNAQTLVNTVNCYGVMGKGIALEFKKRYPDMFKIYAKQCKDKLLRPGILYIYKKSTPWILNFPTKDHWKNPSELKFIELGLKKFAVEYNKKDIYSIAFPLLGTMNGGLNWADVKKLMYDYLLPLENLDVEIYHYQHSRDESTYSNSNLFSEELQIKEPVIKKSR